MDSSCICSSDIDHRIIVVVAAVGTDCGCICNTCSWKCGVDIWWHVCHSRIGMDLRKKDLE